MGIFLDNIFFKVSCIYKTFGVKKLNLKYLVAFLKKQGLQMFNKGGNLSPLKKGGKLKEKCYS